MLKKIQFLDSGIPFFIFCIEIGIMIITSSTHWEETPRRQGGTLSYNSLNSTVSTLHRVYQVYISVILYLTLSLRLYKDWNSGFANQIKSNQRRNINIISSFPIPRLGDYRQFCGIKKSTKASRRLRYYCKTK